MKPIGILLLLLALGVGFGAGYLAGKGTGDEPGAPPEAVADARVALDTLMKSRKQGSSVAGREAMDLVGRIVRGGQEMLEPLAEAIRTVRPHPYNLPVSLDHRAGVPSAYSNKKTALLEAVTRIGGDRAIEILVEVVEDRSEPDWGTRTAAFAYLARHADEKSVRDFYTRFVGKLLTVMRDDFVMTKILLIAYGRLDPGLFMKMSGAYRTGWASDRNADVMSVALHYMDPGRAAAWFMSTLVDESVSMVARKAAARALARAPGHRPAAAQYLLKKKDPDLLLNFLKTLIQLRLEYTDLYNEAKLTNDLGVFRKFCDDQIADLESIETLVREMETTLGPEMAQRVGIASILQTLRERRKNMQEMRDTRND